MSSRPIGRPRGEVRCALAHGAQAHASAWRGGLTFHELVAFVPGMSRDSPGDLRAVRLTVQAMVDAGELVRVGKVRVPGANRPANLYAPAQQPAPDAGQQLQDVLARMARLGA